MCSRKRSRVAKLFQAVILMEYAELLLTTDEEAAQKEKKMLNIDHRLIGFVIFTYTDRLRWESIAHDLSLTQGQYNVE